MIVRIAIALTMGVALLAGCSSSDSTAPTSLPSLTSPAAESDSATPTQLPTPPPAAEEHTPAGAAAFVRFYIELINDAYRTGHSDPLRHYATDECDSCSSIANAVDDIYADGGRAVGGQLTINSITPTGVAEGVQTSVMVDTTRDRYRRFDRSGEVSEDLRAEDRLLIFDLDWSEDAWHLTAIRSQRSIES